jgi:hypothetical protein
MGTKTMQMAEQNSKNAMRANSFPNILPAQLRENMEVGQF